MEYTNKPSLFIIPKGSIKKPDILVFEVMNDKWNEASPHPYISTVKTQGGVHVAQKAFVEHVVMIEQGCLQVYVASKPHRTIHYGIKGEEVDDFRDHVKRLGFPNHYIKNTESYIPVPFEKKSCGHVDYGVAVINDGTTFMTSTL